MCAVHLQVEYIIIWDRVKQFLGAYEKKIKRRREKSLEGMYNKGRYIREENFHGDSEKNL